MAKYQLGEPLQDFSGTVYGKVAAVNGVVEIPDQLEPGGSELLRKLWSVKKIDGSQQNPPPSGGGAAGSPANK